VELKEPARREFLEFITTIGAVAVLPSIARLESLPDDEKGEHENYAWAQFGTHGRDSLDVNTDGVPVGLLPSMASPWFQIERLSMEMDFDWGGGPSDAIYDEGPWLTMWPKNYILLPDRAPVSIFYCNLKKEDSLYMSYYLMTVHDAMVSYTPDIDGSIKMLMSEVTEFNRQRCSILMSNDLAQFSNPMAGLI